jgi:hypothetical protein
MKSHLLTNHPVVIKCCRISVLLLVFAVGASLFFACDSSDDTGHISTDEESDPILSGVYFPVQTNARTGMTMLITGNVILEDRFLRITGNGYSYLIIWPDGYTLLAEDGALIVSGEEGKIKIRVGDTIIAGGGEGPKSLVVHNNRANSPEDAKVRSTCLQGWNP